MTSGATVFKPSNHDGTIATQLPRKTSPYAVYTHGGGEGRASVGWGYSESSFCGR